MKRTRIDLDCIADIRNLTSALYKAAKGKRYRDNVAVFLDDVDEGLNILSRDIRAGLMPYGRFRSFQVFDPKKRLIHAACFEDRVFHHAVMNLAGPLLEQAMTPVSYACRPGMGVYKAVKQVQLNLRRFQWYCKIDIAGYFASIDHDLVLGVLMSRFKGREFEKQLERILRSYQVEPGKGLPVGSLTSQYFANYFLDGLDRFLMADSRVRASVRYMDDIVFWGDSKQSTRTVLDHARAYLHAMRCLVVKTSVQLQPSRQGITFCGFKVSKGAVRLSRRKKRRYQQRRRYWEELYWQGDIDELRLQSAYSAVQAITAGTESREWRKENLRRHPPSVV